MGALLISLNLPSHTEARAQLRLEPQTQGSRAEKENEDGEGGTGVLFLKAVPTKPGLSTTTKVC
jgi:hypothetical protein